MFYYERLTVILPVPEKSVCYSVVSTIKDVRHKAGGFTLFSIVTYSELLGGGVMHLFILILHLYSRVTHKKKFRTHHLPKEEIFGPTKNRPVKSSDPRNTNDKAFVFTKYQRKTFWTHEIPTRKKLWTPQILTSKSFGSTKAQWQDGTRPTEFNTILFCDWIKY